MSDLIERLREKPKYNEQINGLNTFEMNVWHKTACEAADELERLTAEVIRRDEFILAFLRMKVHMGNVMYRYQAHFDLDDKRNELWGDIQNSRDSGSQEKTKSLSGSLKAANGITPFPDKLVTFCDSKALDDE